MTCLTLLVRVDLLVLCRSLCSRIRVRQTFAPDHDCVIYLADATSYTRQVSVSVHALGVCMYVVTGSQPRTHAAVMAQGSTEGRTMLEDDLEAWERCVNYHTPDKVILLLTKIDLLEESKAFTQASEKQSSDSRVDWVADSGLACCSTTPTLPGLRECPLSDRMARAPEGSDRDAALEWIRDQFLTRLEDPRMPVLWHFVRTFNVNIIRYVSRACIDVRVARMLVAD